MKHKLLLALLLITLGSQSAWAAKGGNKPPPEPQPGQAAFVDANGVLIGDVQTNVTSSGAYVLLQVDEKIYQAVIGAGDELVDFRGYAYYDGPNCTGNIYVESPPEIIAGNEILGSLGKDGIFYTTESDTPSLVYIASSGGQTGGNTQCDPSYEQVVEMYDTVPVLDTNVYARPFKLKLFPAQ